MGVDCIVINKKTKQYFGWGERRYNTEDEDSLMYKSLKFLEEINFLTGGEWEIVDDYSHQYHPAWGIDCDPDETSVFFNEYSCITKELYSYIKKREEEKKKSVTLEMLKDEIIGAQRRLFLDYKKDQSGE